MSKLRTLAILLSLAVAGGLVLVVQSTPASATSCAKSWQSSTVYWEGDQASRNGRNYKAKWWTQNEVPPGSNPVWQDRGVCKSGKTRSASSDCDYPNWADRAWYTTGTVVRYTDGKFYIAEHDNPRYDPIISTWYWDPYTCGSGTPTPPADGPTARSLAKTSGKFVVSEAQFNRMFPGRKSFYTYSGLIAALSAYPEFSNTGDGNRQRQEAAAFLANVYHETGGLAHVVEQNTSKYSNYCDSGQPYGCPAGQAAYYGRGPIQLSWNSNYNAAGKALGLPLLSQPWLVQNNPSVAWKTGIWYWMTQNGPGSTTAHNAMVNGAGFGATVRSINGSRECNGRGSAQVNSRVNSYKKFVGILGVSPGNNLYC
ncbi:glycoside hydrolase family 19 protein [Micromonospora sp. NPDC049102]|uniref:glycoside hydrolase family 19 protein n=1 Tax=Micromonospora sp. NPDC049102 TaxID=3364265 RepID=UPI003712748C